MHGEMEGYFRFSRQEVGKRRRVNKILSKKKLAAVKNQLRFPCQPEKMCGIIKFLCRVRRFISSHSEVNNVCYYSRQRLAPRNSYVYASML